MQTLVQQFGRHLRGSCQLPRRSETDYAGETFLEAESFQEGEAGGK
jgi:hypothetical protein